MGNKEPVVSADYVLTVSVKANLKDLSRVVSARYKQYRYLIMELCHDIYQIKTMETAAKLSEA